MRVLIAAAVALSALPAVAGTWSITTFKDPITNEMHKAAVLPAVSGAAVLRIQCRHGFVTPEIDFETSVGAFGVSTSFQFDDETVVQRVAGVSSDGRRVWPWSNAQSSVAIKRLSYGTRLRVQLFPIGVPAVSLDFDLSGASEAIAQVKC
jgi:hypothetical protein